MALFCDAVKISFSFSSLLGYLYYLLTLTFKKKVYNINTISIYAGKTLIYPLIRLSNHFLLYIYFLANFSFDFTCLNNALNILNNFIFILQFLIE